MKTTFLFLFALSVFFISCSNDESSEIFMEPPVQSAEFRTSESCEFCADFTIPNHSFENGCTNTQLVNAFQNGCVSGGWLSLANSSDIYSNLVSNGVNFQPVIHGDRQALLAAYSTNGTNDYQEGILLNYDFVDAVDISYCFSIDYQASDVIKGVNGDVIANCYKPNMDIYLTNGINAPLGGNTINLINVEKTPVASELANYQWNTFSSNPITLDRDYTQLVIFNAAGNIPSGSGREYGILGVDNIQISCCSDAINGIDFEINSDRSYTFSPVFQHQVPITDFLWDFGDNSTSTSERPSHTYASDGIYTVCLTFTNEQGCTGKVTLEVEIGDCRNSRCELYLSIDDCILTVCPGRTCVAPYSFSMATPDGPILNWSIPFSEINPCREFVLDQSGIYYISMTNGDGCVINKRITVDCDTSDTCDPDNPNWIKPNTIFPRFTWLCTGNTIRMQSRIDLYTECDDCCVEVPRSQKNIHLTYHWIIVNKSKNNIVLKDHSSELATNNCGSLMSTGVESSVPCQSIDIGDVIEFNWTITVDQLEGCGYLGANPFSGTYTEVFSSSVYEQCCE